MTQSENEAAKKQGLEPDPLIAPVKRMKLVATVAGSVAASIVTAPSKKANTAEAIAEIAVDIAEAIVKRAGL